MATPIASPRKGSISSLEMDGIEMWPTYSSLQPPPPSAKRRPSINRRRSSARYSARYSGTTRYSGAYSGAARHSGHSWLQLDLESFLPLELNDPRIVRRGSDDGDLLPIEQDIIEDPAQKSGKKSVGFMLAFLALAVVAFVSSLDATTLSVALPVSLTS